MRGQSGCPSRFMLRIKRNRPGLSMHRSSVAQVFNLPYRRFSNRQTARRTTSFDICPRLSLSCVLPTGKSAIRQTGKSALQVNADSWSPCTTIFWDWRLPMNRVGMRCRASAAATQRSPTGIGSWTQCASKFSRSGLSMHRRARTARRPGAQHKGLGDRGPLAVRFPTVIIATPWYELYP